MTQRHWIGIAVDVLLYWGSVLLFVELTEHGLSVVDWQLTPITAVSWLIWAIFMASLMAFIRARQRL